MSQPLKYTRSFSFTNFSTVTPFGQLPGPSIDAEFDGVGASLKSITANIAKLQRDDGALVNGAVGVEQLSSAVMSLIGQDAFVVRGQWVAATAYKRGDFYSDANKVYIVMADHTAGAISTDIADGKVVGPVFFPDTAQINAFAAQLATSSGAAGIGTGDGGTVDADLTALKNFKNALGVSTVLAGALGIGAHDYAAGAKWSTVQGFINTVIGNSGADSVGYSSGVSYGAGSVGKAVKDLFGQHSNSVTDPTLDGALNGLAPDGNSTKSATRHVMNLTGTRTKAKIALGIEVSDNQSGPASGPGSPTPDSASYGLSIVNYRPNWNTSAATGETNGINVFIRQAASDAAGMLSNILTRSGFGATLESYTASADVDGAVVRAVNLQAGVVNSRDGGEYGYVAQASSGLSLTAAFCSRELPGASWSNAFEHSSSTTTLWWVRAADGAMFGGSVLPRVDAGANLGDASLRYDAAFVRRLYRSPYSVGTLPSAASNQGVSAFVTDSSVAASGNFGAVVAAGGANAVPVYSDGTNWRIG